MEEKIITKKDPVTLPDRLTHWIGSVPSLIVHTIFFVVIFIFGVLGFDWEMLMIFLTTAVSLEAIYLAIFIQMSVNKTTVSLASVEEDIDEIAEDVEEIAEDIDEIQTDVDELQEDVEEIQVDVSDIQKDIDEIQEEVDDMSEDVDGLAKGDKKEEKRALAQKELLKSIHKNMNKVKGDLEKLRASKQNKPASKPPSKAKPASAVIKTAKSKFLKRKMLKRKHK